MSSFDIVSEFKNFELMNAVDQSNREVNTRFDFKGTDTSFELQDQKITFRTETDFQLKQMLDILRDKLARRDIDARHLELGEPDIQLKTATQLITLKEGISRDIAKKIIDVIRQEKKLKVQATMQGDKVRVVGKKRNDLQATIQLLRDQELEIPLQFENFRD